MTASSMPDILTAFQSGDCSAIDTGPGWSQGRATFGGLAASFAAAAMQKLVPGDKPLRSLQVMFTAPLPPEGAVAQARLLRSGRSVAQTVCDLMVDDDVVLHASAAFGAPRPTLAAPSEAPFSPIPREKVPAMPDARTGAPDFLKRFDMHWTEGAAPGTGIKSRRISLWAKHTDDMQAFSVEKIIALADIPAPVIMSHYNQFIMGSSLSWSLEFLVPLDEVKGDWFYIEFDLDAAANGYCQQSGRIFNEDGVLVALSRQCMVYFEPK